MNEVLWFALLVLAVYRVSLLLATEDGPFEVFSWFRAVFRIEYGSDDWVVKGLHCPLCIGFWLSFAAGLFLYEDFLQYMVCSLAIAGASTFMTMIGGVPE